MAVRPLPGVSERDTMKPRLKSSRAARDLIKAHEAFLSEAAPRGRRWVVGYGHTAAARQGQTVSREDGELLLLYDVLQAEAAIETAVGEDLPGAMRDALVSFACSIGTGAFKVSDVARLSRDGRHLEAAAALETWVRAEEEGRLVVSERLVRRRAAEKALYLKGLQSQEAAPAATLQSETRSVGEPPAAAPRLGPLVDLELEFVDPPEPGGMVVDVPGEPASASLVESPSEPATEPSADSGSVLRPEETEASGEAPAAAESVPETRPGEDAARSVMARMTAQMSQTLSVPAPRPESEPEATPEPEPEPVRPDAVLGFSFLTAQPVKPAPAPARSGPVPVYGGAVGTVAVETPASALAIAKDPVRGDSPAQATGYSGEVQAVGRPADTDDDEEEADTADGEDLHPGVLTGSAPERQPAPPVAAVQGAAPRPAGGGNWVFLANLVAGLALTGLGIWDILAQDANGASVEFGWFGPVAAAMGVVLVIASGWMLISRRKPAASEPSWDEEDQA